MRLSDTIARLVAQPRIGPLATADRLGKLAFAPNPGALEARTYLPADLPPGAPLVVVLHGCTQTAASYDHGTGWSALADRAGFALLFAEQRRANNPNMCFNWFEPADTRRGSGEVASMAAMVAAMLAAYRCDPARVYVTGLSAGGAMTAAMLATYPEIFAAGAIIGGMPFGCAAGVGEALAQMRGHGSAREGAQAIHEAAAGYTGRWPAVAIWQGDADQTVAPVNADRLVEQWRSVRGIASAPAIEDGERWTHRIWRGSDGAVAVEEWRVAGMGHGVPIDPHGADGLGATGPFMLDVGLASTAVIAREWGLIRPAEAEKAPQREEPVAQPPPAKTGIQGIIDQALRAAGLLR